MRRSRSLIASRSQFVGFGVRTSNARAKGWRREFGECGRCRRRQRAVPPAQRVRCRAEPARNYVQCYRREGVIVPSARVKCSMPLPTTGRWRPRTALGDEAFVAAFAAGRALSLDAVIAEWLLDEGDSAPV